MKKTYKFTLVFVIIIIAIILLYILIHKQKKESDSMNIDNSKITDQTSDITGETTEAQEIIPSLDQLNTLSQALDYMVHYRVFYDKLDGDPGEQFWDHLSSALFTNSFFGPFSNNDWEIVWSNDRVAEAGSLVTGYNLKCSAYPDGLDRSKAASPYLFSSEKENITIEALEDNTIRITYDMIWYSVSTDTNPGRTRVTALLKPNENSPLDSYSIVSLQGEVVAKPS